MLAERIKKLREQNNLSQEGLGKILGLTGPAIARWEKGTAEPNSKILIKLADLFNVSTDYLLGNDKETKKEIELLKNALRNSGFMKGKDDLTDEEFNTLMDFIKANEKFLFKDK